LIKCVGGSRRQSCIEVFTMLLGDDSLFYALAEEQVTFRRIVGSIRIMD
jgi:hypothetical protein